MILVEMVRMKPVCFKRDTYFHCFEGNTGLSTDSIYTAGVMRSDSKKKASLGIWRQDPRSRRSRKLLLPANCRN